MQKVDLQINARWVLPIYGQQNGKKNIALENHAVVIDQAAVKAVLPIHEAAQIYQASKQINLDKHILLPSLTNHHCSLGASAFHHIGFDLPSNLRLQNHLLPLQQKHLSTELIEIASELSIAGLFKSGSGSFNSHYLSPKVSAKIAHKHSVTANFAYPITGNSFGQDHKVAEQLAAALQLRDDFKHRPGISFSLAIDSLNQLEDSQLSKIAAISNELDLKLEVNLNPISNTVKTNSAQTSFNRLKRFGLFSPALKLHHLSSINRNDLEFIAKTKTFCTISPQAQLMHSSSLAPLSALLNLDATLGLATDNYLSSNLNILKELSLAAWLGKLEAGSAQVLSAIKLLKMALMPLSSALKTSAISNGIPANLCAIELSSDNNNCDPFEQIVYTANQQKVSHLWVNGQVKVNDYQLTDIDESYLRKSLGSWQQKFK
ncbi:MAG: hypothetical protein HWE16_05685 [Gammaproteobacteria bacterium]|nr:hypothetical protein [Gammaproteobacteria bacterium]